MGTDHACSHIERLFAEYVAAYNVDDSQGEGDDTRGDDDLPEAETERAYTGGVFVQVSKDRYTQYHH